MLTDKLNIYYQNVRGLRSKTETFSLNLLSSSYDVICLTETWLNEEILNGELFTSDYTVYRRDRDREVSGKTTGGGVLISVHSRFPSERIQILETDNEDLWVSVKVTPSITYFICCVYFPSRNRLNYSIFYEKVELFINGITNSNNIIITGDFNLPISGVNDDLSTGGSARGDLKLFLDLCNLTMFNNIRNSLSDRTLDLIVSNMEDVTVSAADDILVPVDLYHPPLEIDLSIARHTSSKLRGPGCFFSYDFSKADFYSLYVSLRDFNWTFLYACRSVNEAVEYFYAVFYELLDKNVPTKKMFTNKYPIWFNKNIIKLLKLKEKFRKKFKKSGNLEQLNLYKIYRAQSKAEIRKAYNNYVHMIESNVSKGDIKHVFSFLKSRKDRAMSSSFRFPDGRLCDDSQTIADGFAEYFSHIYDGNGATSFTMDEILDNATEFSSNIILKSFCVEEVGDEIKSLQSKRSTGPDGLPMYLFKACSEILKKPLAYLYNLSLKNNVFPEMWKLTKTVPVHKKGSKTEFSNYRPISLLSTPAKVFERLLHKHIFFNIKSKISINQHGFFSNRSITSNLLNFCEEIHNNFQAGKQLDVVYTDFSKAFDRVDHMILLKKLHLFGLSNNLVNFFFTYLVGRRQYVSYMGCKSVEFLIRSGVPQGSNLGPLFFIIFINDIELYLSKSKVLLYADDMKIYKSISNKQDAIDFQNDISNLIVWSQINKLEFNFSKCSVITFSRKRVPLIFNYSMSNIHLVRLNKIRDLGVTLDSELIFKDHIFDTASKAAQMLGFILRTSRVFNNIHTIKLLYRSLVRSRLEFASIIWNPHNITYIEEIEKVQKRFLKYLFFRQFKQYPTYIPYTHLLKLHDFQSLYDRRRVNTLIYFRKLMRGELDDPNTLEQVNLYVPRHYNRSAALFYSRSCTSNYALNSPVNSMMRLFNGAVSVTNLDLFCSTAYGYRARISNLSHLL
jgi:hypothetical protein